MKALLFFLLLPAMLYSQADIDTIKQEAILSHNGRVWAAVVYQVTVTIPQPDPYISAMCGACDEKKIYYLDEKKRKLVPSIKVWLKSNDE